MLANNAIFRYLNEVKREMSVVSWPSRNQTTKLTLLVIAVSLVVGLVIGAMDIILTEGFTLLINR